MAELRGICEHVKLKASIKKVYVAIYKILYTEQFYNIFKSLIVWHVAKCIPALKWLCFNSLIAIKHHII